MGHWGLWDRLGTGDYCAGTGIDSILGGYWDRVVGVLGWTEKVLVGYWGLLEGTVLGWDA